MHLQRVALIYDDRQRPETTGVYCRRALQSLVNVEHFEPDALAVIPADGFDLYLNIDDGLEYQLPAHLRPSAWWAIDTHLEYDRCRRKAATFDFVFAAQRDGATLLDGEGIAPAQWLPLACDPDIHRRFELDKVHDIAFVGNLFPGPRAQLLAALKRRFRSTFAGRAYFEEYEFARPELQALIPSSAKRVLDVGCGAGRLGEALKARQAVTVAGIEIAASAAALARARLDEVFEGDVEKLNLPFAPAAFDCVVCGDVLEHLREPERFLRRARGWLEKDGCVVASLPNVRHHSVVTALLEGNWSYEPAGLLDETHLSFFTRRDMAALFERAGFEVADLRLVPGPGYDEWRQSGCPGEVRVGRLHIADIAPEEAEEFFVYQYLLVAKPREAFALRAFDGQSREGREDPGTGAADANQGPLVCAEVASTGSIPPDVTAEGGRTRAGSVSLRIAFLGNFEQPWSTEGYAADALEGIGHTVRRIHEYGATSSGDVLEQIKDSRAGCFLFFKGRIGVDPGDVQAVLRPDPRRLVEVLRESPVPSFMWYYDRVHNYSAEPSRVEWMRRVAPLCRVAFVTDGGLAKTEWANWHVLRQGISRPTVTAAEVPEQEREDVAFLGQLYGPRADELASVRREFPLNVISNTFGRELSTAIRNHRIIIGPQYPSVPGYWSDRVYVVLGHGGFFLAPEVPGMREEGLQPGVHYAPLGDDPIRDVHYWLKRPKERAQIARQGQDLVLARFTYEERVRELCARITATMIDGDHPTQQSYGKTFPTRRSTGDTSDVGLTAGRAWLRFRHRRKLGDIIYSLPVVGHLGGGILYLDPSSLNGAQDQNGWRRHFETLLPFLQQQLYLREARIYNGEPFDVDLDSYLRTTHGTRSDRVTIVANHFIGLGLDPPKVISPWLVADTAPSSYPVVLHRSHHYHGPADYSFLVEIEEELFCVGSREERQPFEMIGATPLVTKDVRELAAVLNACGVFIGNQSLPLALAAGLNKPRMIEESDCLPNCTLGGPDEFVLTTSAAANHSAMLRLLKRASTDLHSTPPGATAPETGIGSSSSEATR